MDWQAIDDWEVINVQAGNTDCSLCVGSGFFSFFEVDQRPGELGRVCDCIAGQTMPIALRRFLAGEGYTDQIPEVA